MGLMGNGEGHTLLILTDEESRLIRGVLETNGECSESPLAVKAVGAFNNGVARGTAKLKQEAADEAKRKRDKR